MSTIFPGHSRAENERRLNAITLGHRSHPFYLANVAERNYIKSHIEAGDRDEISIHRFLRTAETVQFLEARLAREIRLQERVFLWQQHLSPEQCFAVYAMLPEWRESKKLEREEMQQRFEDMDQGFVGDNDVCDVVAWCEAYNEVERALRVWDRELKFMEYKYLLKRMFIVMGDYAEGEEEEDWVDVDGQGVVIKEVLGRQLE